MTSLLLGGILFALAQSRPLTPAEFAAHMDGLATSISSTEAASAASLAIAVPVSERVASGADSYDVPLGWVRDGLNTADTDRGKWPAVRQELVTQLHVLAREADALGRTPRLDGPARDTLASVLSQASFRRLRKASWQAALRQRIAEWLADIWERSLGRRVGQRNLAQIAAWAASGAAILVLFVWLARLARRHRTEQPLTVGPINVAAPGHVLGLEAAALLRAGRLREGARAAYRAGVRRLEEEGAFRADAARTPREYVHLLPLSHRRRAPLSALTSAFERIWYGDRVPAPDEGTRLLAILQELECLPSDRAK